MTALRCDPSQPSHCLVTPENDLNTALKRFTELNLDELPVVEKGNPQKLLGTLRRKDVIAHYIQTLLAHKQAMQGGGVGGLSGGGLSLTAVLQIHRGKIDGSTQC